VTNVITFRASSTAPGSESAAAITPSSIDFASARIVRALWPRRERKVITYDFRNEAHSCSFFVVIITVDLRFIVREGFKIASAFLAKQAQSK